MTAVLATEPRFRTLEKDTSQLAKIDTSSEEFQNELHAQYKRFTNYKYFAFGLPNAVLIAWLLPHRYPVTLRSIVGYTSVGFGAYFTHRNARRNAITNMKTRLVVDHYKTQTGEAKPPDMDIGELLLGQSSNINVDDIKVE